MIAELIEKAGDNIVALVMLAIGIGSVFIEVSKIKFNPWSALFKWIGQTMNKDLKDELTELKSAMDEQSKKIDEIQDEVDRNEIKRIRAEIFTFADSCRLDVKHTKENFEHIIDIHDDYEKLLEKHEMKNGRMTSEFDYIKDVYRVCMEKDNFI